jgi:hypothetical protein
MIRYALARFRRGTGAAFGSCLCSARIIAICAIIGSPPCSPISISTSAAVCHCDACCSAFGSFVTYRAASRSVTSGFLPGSSIGSKNCWSHDTTLTPATRTDPPQPSRTLDKHLISHPHRSSRIPLNDGWHNFPLVFVNFARGYRVY